MFFREKNSKRKRIRKKSQRKMPQKSKSSEKSLPKKCPKTILDPKNNNRNANPKHPKNSSFCVHSIKTTKPFLFNTKKRSKLNCCWTRLVH
jgi:hypothetical protein